ncbi:MAG: hypothetical protein J7L54_04920 [Elusimicrobia bacterium]|nr:hypothetical protein [Elusimicrobiota bacterium]
MDPVAPTSEANLTSRQIGVVFEWNDFDENFLGFPFKNGRYFLRYRRYKFPYLYGFKIGRENTFSPSEVSLLALSASFNYLFLEDTLITPSVLIGIEISNSRDFNGNCVSVVKSQMLLGKEFSKIMPYFGMFLEWIDVGLSDDSKSKTAVNFQVGCKFYTSPGVSYGIDLNIGRMNGWGVYFNNSW